MWFLWVAAMGISFVSQDGEGVSAWGTGGRGFPLVLPTGRSGCGADGNGSLGGTSELPGKNRGSPEWNVQVGADSGGVRRLTSPDRIVSMRLGAGTGGVKRGMVVNGRGLGS